MVSFLNELWIPMLLSGVLCFIMSALAWTVFSHHRGEWKRLPVEPEVLELLRRDQPPPGLYAFPFGLHQDMNRTDVKLAFERGPVGYMAIADRHRPSMPKMMAAMAVYFLVVSFIVGYVAWTAAPAPKLGPPAMLTARITFTVALLAYAASSLPDCIWFGRPWRAFFALLVDATLYATVTAAVFTRLWPQ